MGKIDSGGLHKSGKVPIMESLKSSMGENLQKEKRKPPTCSICKLVGHNSKRCKMSPYNEHVCADLVEWDVDQLTIVNEYEIKASTCHKALDLNN